MAFFISHRVDNFSHSSFWWLFHVFTLIIQPSTFLVIIKPISTYKMTILATKITQIGPLWPEIWHFLYRKEWINSRLVVPKWSNNGFTPIIQPITFLVIIKPISTYEITILDTKITQIGPLRHEIWHFLSFNSVNLK